MPSDAPQPADLPTLVAQARAARGMSYRDVERASGGVVTHSTVHKIEQGQRRTLEPRTLAGLATALGVPAGRLRAAIGQPVRVPDAPFTLPDRANALTAKQRRLVLAVVDGLLEARQG